MFTRKTAHIAAIVAGLTALQVSYAQRAIIEGASPPDAVGGRETLTAALVQHLLGTYAVPGGGRPSAVFPHHETSAEMDSLTKLALYHYGTLRGFPALEGLRAVMARDPAGREAVSRSVTRCVTADPALEPVALELADRLRLSSQRLEIDEALLRQPPRSGEPLAEPAAGVPPAAMTHPPILARTLPGRLPEVAPSPGVPLPTFSPMVAP